MAAAVWQVYGTGALRAASLAAAERKESWPPELQRYVFVHGGEVIDDADKLPPAAEMAPGVYAVDEDGTVMVTAGGDVARGADAWWTVNASPWRQRPVRRRWKFSLWGLALTGLGIAMMLVLLYLAGMVAQGAMQGEAGNSTLRD